MHVWANPDPPPRYVINFPTKQHWRSKSRLQDIEAGLVDLIRVIDDLDLRSIAIPALGTGLGGLPWRTVRAEITVALDPLETLEVYLCGPK